MNPFRNLLLIAFLTASAVFAGVDPVLLNMVPPDAKVVSGIQVMQSKASPFGQYILSQMSTDDPSFKKFIDETGFDPKRDLSELLIATTGTVDVSTVVLLGRGTFNPAKILNVAKSMGVTPLNYAGVDLLLHKDEKGTEGALGFLDAATAVMGSTQAVKAAIDRRRSGPFLSAELQARVRDLSAANDAWFLSTGPITNLFPAPKAAGAPSPQDQAPLNQAMNGNLFQAVLQASGGVKFGSKDIRFSGEALTRSDKDATALADVIRFVASLVQSNQDGTPQAKQAASLLSSLQLSTQAATMKLSLTMSEAQVEKLLMPQQKKKPLKTTAAL